MKTSRSQSINHYNMFELIDLAKASIEANISIYKIRDVYFVGDDDGFYTFLKLRSLYAESKTRLNNYNTIKFSIGVELNTVNKFILKLQEDIKYINNRISSLVNETLAKEEKPIRLDNESITDYYKRAIKRLGKVYAIEEYRTRVNNTLAEALLKLEKQKETALTKQEEYKKEAEIYFLLSLL